MRSLTTSTCPVFLLKSVLMSPHQIMESQGKYVFISKVFDEGEEMTTAWTLQCPGDTSDTQDFIASGMAINIPPLGLPRGRLALTAGF